MDYRWSKPWDHSIAFFRFRTYHKQLNEMYWAFYYGTAALGKDAGKVKKSGIPSMDYFNFVVDSIDHPNYEVVKDWKRWESSYKEFENLTRVNLLLDANSYFEVYLRSIYTLAMESRPDILLGRASQIDGLGLYKKLHNYHYSEKIAQEASGKYMFYNNLLELTKNDWQKRNNAFSEIFGKTPEFLSKNRKELDEIRTTRNTIGHFFGRNKTDENGEIKLPTDEMLRLADAHLKKLLDVIYRSAKAIDEYLFPSYIGSYECILFCLQYAKRNSIEVSDSNVGSIVVGATTELKKMGYTVSNKYMREAIHIYLAM